MDKIQMKKSVQKYLRNIQKALPLTYKKRKEIMRRFSQGVYEYCSETENITMDMVYHEFGTVEEVRDSLLSEIPSNYVIKHFQIKRFITCFLTFIVILLIGYGIFLRYDIYQIPNHIEVKLGESLSNENK